MQTLGELRYAFIMIPLLFVFVLYVMSGNALALLGTNFMLALISASIVAIVSSFIPLTGNSEATFLSFTVGFALAFWGFSIAGIFGATSGVALWADSLVSWLEGRPSYSQLHPNATTLNVDILNSVNYNVPSILGWNGADIWATVLIVLSFIYGLGIYLMVSSRGQ